VIHIVYGSPYRVSTQQTVKMNKQHRLKLCNKPHAPVFMAV